MVNFTIAEQLLDYARSLKGRQSNPYRARAYRLAAETIFRTERDLRDILEQEGVTGLRALPHVGERIALTIEKFLRTGEWITLDVDAQQQDPQQSVCQIRGIGPRWAHRFQEELNVTTVKELVQASEEGRLTGLNLPRNIVNSLAAVRPEPPATFDNEPTVDELLAADQQFRTKIAKKPHQVDDKTQDFVRRFQTLHCQFGDWTFRIQHSFSPLAQRLGRSQDWVVIQFQKGELSGERTIVTESREFLCGQRVVRGREYECGACAGLSGNNR